MLEVKPKTFVRTNRLAPRLSIGELCQLLGVSAPAIKSAMKRGDRHFARYCKKRCGQAYRPINVAKSNSKIPRWKFEEIDNN